MASNTHLQPAEVGGIDQNTTRGYTLKSTFQNLNSSALRGVPFPSIFNWLKGKQDMFRNFSFV